MYPLYFSAVLKSAKGTVLESGEACLSEAEGAVDFNGESVPLMNLGEKAEIVRMVGERELERFPGRVYRCTRKSLRLTDVPPETLRDAKSLFDVNAHIPVSLALSPDGSTDFPDEKASHIGGNIRFLSSERLRITAFEQISQGQVMVLQTESPQIRLTRLGVRVASRVPLGRSAAVLLCDVLTPSAENRRALARFEAGQGPQIRIL